MSINSMNDLFVVTLKDIYGAEKAILKAMPAMVRKARTGELKNALETHKLETEGQIERLEQVFEMLDLSPRAKKCEAMEGILREAKENMQEIEEDEVLDSGIIGSAQTVEHYEICRYGTLIEWAKDLGFDEAAKLLGQNLEQEKKTDKLLTEIARSTMAHSAAA